LLGLAWVIKGEALIDANCLTEAEQSFAHVLSDFTEATHPLALAGAHRGLGRTALASGRHSQAIDALKHALSLYERLNRVQEAARTEVHLARALDREGDAMSAQTHLENARQKFADIGAKHDLARAEAIHVGNGYRVQ
jgi:tetratricopeptide (TPR) repeat protein